MIEEKQPLTIDYLKKMDAYFRACNYLSACQLYLLDNPLLEVPLKKEHIKKKIVGHWGTIPGQNFIYVHLNRVIKKYDLNMIYISGPGHGGNAIVSNTYLEGTYSEIYPNISEDKEGLRKLFKQFSFPGGISSHVAPETPGSINEGGELGYSLAHAFGAVLDNKDLIAACVVGDGEAETSTLAASWHSLKFLNPITDGAVLPILHLNGYKISNPTIFSRMSQEEIENFFISHGFKPYFVSGSDTMTIHALMARTLDKVITDIKEIQYKYRNSTVNHNLLWPMIVLRTPKGWTGPKMVDGKKIEGTFRAHQVPIPMTKDEHLDLLYDWLKSYKPEELFDKHGRLRFDLRELAPKGNSRMSANPITNGGLVLKSLSLPDIKNYAVKFSYPGEVLAQDMIELGKYIRDIFKLNKDNFRIFGPDETMSNRLGSVFEETCRSWNMGISQDDEYLSRDGRVMDSMLNENLCEGWLEGYLLTGRHGLFASYEAFIRVVDSMCSQHAKWLKMTKGIPWRSDISSLNYILSSNVWQQDHNGYTHQEPGFLDHVANKKSDLIGLYLPPDANSLLSVFEHCMKTRHKINVMVTSKHPREQWLTMDEAIRHCKKGIGIWDFVSSDSMDEPDVVLACAGDTPTLEAVASTTIIKKYLPDIKIRFINVVDLMKLRTLPNDDFNNLFTVDKPIVFIYHGYPGLVRNLLFDRDNKNIVIKGYQEEGSITTPFDMRVQNEIDRFNITKEIVKKLPNLGNKGSHIINDMDNKLIEHREYICEHGIDLEEIRDWKYKK
ncbi:MAG: phosphoketolase family protein [Bacilli bacterium]|nr:phosphoketolase family protein [Bacilli bacterium]